MKISSRFLARTALHALLLSFGFHLLPAQDRNIGVNEVYPADMFKIDAVTSNANESRRLINVKALPAGLNGGVSAVGDGIADDSNAIIAAIDFVMNQLKSYISGGGFNGGVPYWHEYWTIYFPNGTYKVTKPLMYSGARIPDPYIANTDREGTCRLMMVGQSREGVVIKLADGASGYGASATRPIVSFSRFDLTPQPINDNIAAYFQFRNFTINAGTGNPGAVGLDFYGANTARLDNVKITGDGKIGIHLRMASAHGYYSNVTIDGMDYGIYMKDTGGEMETHPTFEYVTLLDQGSAGIYQEGVSSTFRKVQSSNLVTAVKLVNWVSGSEQRQPHLTIVDSQFNNGSSGNTVFQIDGGAIYSRNIAVSGYGSSVKKGSTVVQTGSIAEYVSEAVTSYSSARMDGGPIKGMNMAVEDYPLIPWISDFSQWANVDGYPGSTDAQKVQAAMNSGKKVIYFPRNSYSFNATVNIPATVEQLIGCGTRIIGSPDLFNVNAEATGTLLIHCLNLDSGQVVQSKARPILFENSQSTANLYDSNLTAPGTTVFVNNANGYARDADKTTNITSWVRWNDNEKPSDYQFTADPGSKMWMLGFKSEKCFTVFRVRPGAKLEVLGGVLSQNGRSDANAVSPIRPCIVNEEGEISIVGATIGFKSPSIHYWSPLVRDTQGGVTLNWGKNLFPNRGWNQNVILPLYVSYVPTSGLPGVPTNLTATAGNQQAVLNWGAGSGATSYKLYRATTSNGQGGTPLVSGIAGTTYTNTGLTNGTTYYYKVAAVNGAGTSSLSNEAPATPTLAPVKLTAVTATASDSESANPATKAIDGSTSTRWSASVLSCPPAHWLQLDLGSVQTVNTVKTMFFNGLTYTYDISVSTDNVIFTTVAPSHNTTTPYGWETDTFAPVSARYVRINISSKNGGGPNTKPGIIEAEIYQ